MPEPNGSFADEPIAINGGGKPAAISDNDRANEHSSGIAGPEIIHGYDAIEPETLRFEPVGTLGAGEPGEPGKRRRGRPRKTADSAAPEKVPGSLIDLQGLLLSLHQMGAAMLNVPMLELSDDEAKKLSDGIKEVAKHYNANFDPKKVAIANLVIVAGGIYGTRIMAYRMEHKKAPKEMKPELVPPPATKQKTNGAPAPPTGGIASPSDLWGFQPPVESNNF